MVDTNISAEISRTATVFFLYHEIVRGPSKYSYAVTEEAFRQHLETFKMARADTTRFVRPEVTFDDGHRSDFEIALPLLETAGIKARFFITAGWTGVKPGYMDWTGIEALHRAGHSIGAHGWSHKMLSRCTPDELREELLRPKIVLEQRLGAEITEMSLPGGRLTNSVLEVAKQTGYERIFTSVPAVSQIIDGNVGRVNVANNTRPSDLEGLLREDGRTLRRMMRSHSIKLALRQALGDTLYFKLWAFKNGYVQNDEGRE